MYTYAAAFSKDRTDIADYIYHDVSLVFKAMNRTGANSSEVGKVDHTALSSSAWRYLLYVCMYVCMYATLMYVCTSW